jgi:hypothetical protein
MEKKLVEKLKKINTLTKLSFKEIGEITPLYAIVKYYGHEVGGSYVHDYEVAPKYVQDIEYTTNRKTEWLSSNSGEGGMGWDVYYFKFYYNTPILDKPYEPKGKILRVANSYVAFEYECGYEWSFLYILHHAFLNNDIPSDVNFEIIDNGIYYNNNNIAYIVEYENETNHHIIGHKTDCNRTKFHATYDLLINTNEWKNLFLVIYKEIVQSWFKNDPINCVDINITHSFETGDKICINFDFGYSISIGPNWYVWNRKLYINIISIYNNYKTFIEVIVIERPNDFFSPKKHYLKFEENEVKFSNIFKPDYYPYSKGCIIKLNDEEIKGDPSELILKNKDHIKFSIPECFIYGNLYLAHL